MLKLHFVANNSFIKNGEVRMKEIIDVLHPNNKAPISNATE